MELMRIRKKNLGYISVMASQSLKFIYSEKATNFCEISTVDLSYVDFAKFYGLLRIYELYKGSVLPGKQKFKCCQLLVGSQ